MGERSQRSGPLFGAVALVAACVFGCSSPRKPAVDSNSNWLAVCEVNADCEGDGSCICGLCTRTCSDDAQCAVAGPTASCIEPAAARDDVACAAIVSAASEQVCLAGCDDSGACRPGTRCIEHACWPQPDSVVDTRDANAGAPDPSATGRDSRGPTPSVDFSQLDSSVDFSEPVAPPPPRRETFGGSPELLVGVWEEDEPGVYDQMVIRLELGPATDEGFRGSLTYRCLTGRCNPIGPPPPASDPEASYPPGLNAQAQHLLRTNPLPDTSYPIFDMGFDSRPEVRRFFFSYSNSDLWRDWCALQTSFPTEVTGRPEHACMPDPESCDSVYERAAFLPDDDPTSFGKSLLCCAGGGPCRCDARGCEANYLAAKHTIELKVEAGTMKGIAVIGGDTYSLVLHRQERQP